MPTIIDLRPEIEKVSGRIAIVALLILCLCIKVYTTQFWHDMNVDHRVKCKESIKEMKWLYRLLINWIDRLNEEQCEI